ncbi:MAG TPA: polymer-forming cytoskeletal protein [Candidatus Aminicenantes bacterium]|nr:polymer-forming cytoskeletal protein [Candidatus Aminicenantes bacterium]
MAFNTDRKDDKDSFNPFSSRSQNSESMIGESLTVEGEIHSEEALVIRGKVKGNIHSKQPLVVEESGQVTGDLNGKVITIRGTVKGKVISAQKLLISASGSFCGDISVEKLIIEEGARFKGHVTMDTPAPAQSHKPPSEKTPDKGTDSSKPGH